MRQPYPPDVARTVDVLTRALEETVRGMAAEYGLDYTEDDPRTDGYVLGTRLGDPEEYRVWVMPMECDPPEVEWAEGLRRVVDMVLWLGAVREANPVQYARLAAAVAEIAAEDAERDAPPPASRPVYAGDAAYYAHRLAYGLGEAKRLAAAGDPEGAEEWRAYARDVRAQLDRAWDGD